MDAVKIAGVKMTKQCERCGEKREEQFFSGTSAICIYCEAEIEAVGEPLTKENLGNIMQNQFNKRVE